MTTFVNARVLTLDPQRPSASAITFENGVVTEIGAAPRGTEQIDLGGAVVLPGLVDAHLHLDGMGARERQLDLTGARSLDDALARVGERHRRLPEAAWLVGRGWDQNRWPVAEYPDASSLERVAPGRAVALTRADGHAMWVSPRALELGGVGPSTADPRGGSLLRDARGAPTGVLLDAAMELVSPPKPSREALRADLVAGVAAAARVGLTAVHDMGTTLEMAELFTELAQEGSLAVRVFAHLCAPMAELETRLSAPVRTDRYAEVGVKLFADGALGSHGALLHRPYCDLPTSSGLALMQPLELTQAACRVHSAGLQIAIHAIGDLANARALDAIASAQGADRGRRHRVEHAQILAPADVPRFAALGITASVQPCHATSDMAWVEARLGAERLAGAYAWRTLLASGAHLAFGSDAPIEPENPWYGVHAAVTRTDRSGRPPGGWRPDERLDVLAVLRAFTAGGAWAAHSPGGCIALGAPADFSVVDRDPFRTPPDDLWKIQPLGTWVGGRRVWPAD
ncbi:MAG: amidohydrolase [Polyangiaceae bacterium]|nr:amidohydrolase [Polyangiaceae bacterium]